MANYQPTYLGEIELSEETLAHYGVKGMRWGRRLRGAYSKAVGHIRRRQSADKRRERYVAEKMADELRTGQSHTYGRNFRLPESYAHVQRFINEHHGRAEQRRSMNGPWVKGSQYVYKTTSEQLNRAVDARKKRDGEPRRKRKYKPERT